MLGKPKYKLGQSVKFLWDGGSKEGIVVVVDPRGTFEDDSDVSYDIAVGDEGWYKHIREDFIINN